jgi:CheY-like chemotaxis protein
VPRTPQLILVVEDDVTTRDLYRVALRAAGYTVAAVEDGADALRFVEQQLPDVVILDLDLPRVDGRDVRRELRVRAETQDIPILIATGASPGDLDLGAGDLLLTNRSTPRRWYGRSIARCSGVSSGSDRPRRRSPPRQKFQGE